MCELILFVFGSRYRQIWALHETLVDGYDSWCSYLALPFNPHTSLLGQ